MDKRTPSKEEFSGLISEMSEDEFDVFLYVHQIGLTFAHICRMEDSIIGAMFVCDKIKVKSILKDDAERWQMMLEKRSKLQDSTLGSLIKILSDHDIYDADIRYLRWLKEKRDFFIHRFFNDGRWPGNLNSEHCKHLVRQLLYLQAIFDRGAQRIFKIMSNNKLMVRVEMGEAGALMMNFDSLFGQEQD